MSGSTLIKTKTRNEVLEFLQYLAQTSTVAEIATEAKELADLMAPKFIKKPKLGNFTVDATQTVIYTEPLSEAIEI